MFSKKEEKLESFIGNTSSIKGEITSKGTLRVDGSIDGTIEADWLIVGEKGFIKGNVTARCIVVGGLVEGNLTARETVEIKPKGKVNGDISTAKLTVNEGGVINGRTSMISQANNTSKETKKENKKD